MILLHRFAFVLSAILFVPAVALASFTVTKTADTADGVCDADCSLREAVIAANANIGPDTIILPPGMYVLILGDIVISEHLGIFGFGNTPADTIINGNFNDRVFDIISPGNYDLQNLSIINGDNAGDDIGGGIFNSGNLTLTDVIVRNNRSVAGGGISQEFNATLTLFDSTITDNVSLLYGACRGCW